jgi:hypothetical protein
MFIQGLYRVFLTDMDYTEFKINIKLIYDMVQCMQWGVGLIAAVRVVRFRERCPHIKPHPPTCAGLATPHVEGAHGEHPGGSRAGLWELTTRHLKAKISGLISRCLAAELRVLNTHHLAA